MFDHLVIHILSYILCEITCSSNFSPPIDRYNRQLQRILISSHPERRRTALSEDLTNSSLCDSKRDTMVAQLRSKNKILETKLLKMRW